MKYSDAYPAFTEVSLTGNWSFREHKRWFGLFPDVLVLEVQVVGWEEDETIAVGNEQRVLRWRDATRRDVIALGLIP